MQSRNLLLFTLLFLISTVFLSSCTIPSSVRKAYNFDSSKIFLVVNESETELVIDSNNGKKCSKSGKKGCINAAKGTIAVIDFHLIRSNGWHITEMKICLGEDKPTPANPCALKKADIAQFSAGARGVFYRLDPAGNGEIKLTGLSTGLSKFNLLDSNSFPEDYFYTITACKDAQSDVCVSLDPPIENKGGGRNAHAL